MNRCDWIQSRWAGAQNIEDWRQIKTLLHGAQMAVIGLNNDDAEDYETLHDIAEERLYSLLDEKWRQNEYLDRN